TKTICPARVLLLLGTLTMPRMRVRVVCGLAEMMATFSPTNAFSKVDLPAFGRPRMLTDPERMLEILRGPILPGLFHRLLRLHPLHPQAIDTTFVGLQDFEAKVIDLDHCATLWDAAQSLAHQTCDRRRFMLFRRIEIE